MKHRSSEMYDTHSLARSVAGALSSFCEQNNFLGVRFEVVSAVDGDEPVYFCVYTDDVRHRSTKTRTCVVLETWMDGKPI